MTERQKAAALRWAIFGLALGLVPVGFAFLARLVVQSAAPDDPIARGALFLLAATVAFGGVGNLVGRVNAKETTYLIVGGVALLNGMLAALLYAAVSNAPQANGGIVLWVSAVQYLISAGSGGACVVLSVEEV